MTAHLRRNQRRSFCQQILGKAGSDWLPACCNGFGGSGGQCLIRAPLVSSSVCCPTHSAESGAGGGDPYTTVSHQVSMKRTSRILYLLLYTSVRVRKTIIPENMTVIVRGLDWKRTWLKNPEKPGAVQQRESLLQMFVTL